MLAVVFAAPSFADDDAVTRELDAYAQANSLSLENISSPEPKTPRKVHEFEWGTERYSYLYREFVSGAEFVRFKGFYNGFVFSYTFRPVDVDSFAEIIDNLFRVELRYATGRVDYTGSGTWDGLKDQMYEVRGIVGREYDINPTLQVMPYAGIGYRYLDNGFQAIPARTVNGRPFWSAYNRESKYFYVPMGVEICQAFSGGWHLGGILEYDFWLNGEQASHFEDMYDDTGVSAGWDPVYNKQEKGFGLRGSLKIDKAFSRMKLGIEPYYRYWKVEDSEKQVVTGPGVLGVNEVFEPQNITQEIGVKVGLIF
jgi:hypothetical protein